jgi:hypothetical protein
MVANYCVWDDVSGNIVADYDTRDEAVRLLRDMLDTNGPDGVRDLVIIEYPADGSDPVAILEGGDILAEQRSPAQS